MKHYEEVVAELRSIRDEKYRAFNERIANIPSGSSIGVRIPALRAYAKALVRTEGFSLEALFTFPNEIYEIRLLQCLCVGYCKMPFGERVGWIRRAVSILDGWSVCDIFCATLRIPQAVKGDFLTEIEYYVRHRSQFSQRFAYVMLLGSYVEEAYLPFIFSALDRAETQYYYTHMGAAWLLCEMLVKFYDAGVAYLKEGALDEKTKRKAVQKACESFRLTVGQKNFLKLLKK